MGTGRGRTLYTVRGWAGTTTGYVGRGTTTGYVGRGTTTVYVGRGTTTGYVGRGITSVGLGVTTMGYVGL
jgi:hypothetical protein